MDQRVAEKEEEKILGENDSIKGVKEIEDYDKASELIRKELKIQERNEQYIFISPKAKQEIAPCDPKEIMKNTKIINHIKELSFLIKKRFTCVVSYDIIYQELVDVRIFQYKILWNGVFARVQGEITGQSPEHTG